MTNKKSNTTSMTDNKVNSSIHFDISYLSIMYVCYIYGQISGLQCSQHLSEGIKIESQNVKDFCTWSYS